MNISSKLSPVPVHYPSYPTSLVPEHPVPTIASFIPYTGFPKSSGRPSLCHPPIVPQSTAVLITSTVAPLLPVPALLLPIFPVALPLLPVSVAPASHPHQNSSAPQYVFPDTLTSFPRSPIANPHFPALPIPTLQANTLPVSFLPPPHESESPRPSESINKPGFVDTGGATSFAQRHPLKDVQISRFRVRGSKSDAVKLGQAERRTQKAEKASQLQEGVDGIIKLRDHAIKELADKLSMDEKSIQTLVNGGTHYVKHRRPGAFNTLVHKATGEMNEGKSAFLSLG
jgi:hypothetical protein